MPSLFVVRGRDQGKHFQLSDLVYRIGRDATSDIQLLDSEASRNHAELRVDERSGCELVDLGSSNGTKVNGEKISRHKLASGDRIEIGGTLLIFTGTGQPTAMEAAHSVDIVRQTRENDRSRIVSSISPPATKSQSLDLSDSAVLSRADRSLEVMYLTAIAVGRANDLDELLNRILRLIFDWVEADRGVIMLGDPESSELQPAARCDRTRGEDDAQEYRLAISHTILDYVMEHEKGVRTSDARDDNRFDSAASIVQAGVREAICVPLQGRYGIVGALYIDTYISPGERIATGIQQRFNDDHLRLITAIGHQAALAIEDTFYYSALVQSERLAAMGQTIATLSHHIKNILQGIRGGSYLIEAGLERDDSDAVRRGWAMVDRNQQRISNLVLDMLTFSKEREPEKVEADWNETASDVVELMQSRADEMKVILESEFACDVPAAMFDPDAIHRALLNLVTNAIDAAAGVGDAADNDSDFEVDDISESTQPSRGTPRVLVKTCFDPELGWCIDVIDNGPGIAQADREKIFSLFESSKGARGTGLGLPVSAKIMREHGGDIQVLDAGDLGGSCFRLRLPPLGSDMDALTGTGTMS